MAKTIERRHALGAAILEAVGVDPATAQEFTLTGRAGQACVLVVTTVVQKAGALEIDRSRLTVTSEPIESEA